MENTPFLTMFPCCEEKKSSCGGLEKAYITDVSVDTEENTLSMDAHFAAPPVPVELAMLQKAIRDVYGLGGVTIVPDYEKIEKVPVRTPAEQGGVPKGTVLLGKAIKGKPVPMSTVTLESGKVTIEGEVCEVSSKPLTKRGGAVLSFDITDNTGAFRVSRFFRADDEDKKIIDEVKEGDWLAVYGEVTYSKYDEDIVIDPKSIVRGKKYIRPDNAEVKRVELHAHTRFSALDALTDPDALVSRAAYWGMPAIAVTDHGVCQAFPDMWKAGKKKDVKIIYGVECYYVNDLDGNTAVHGKSSLPLDTDYIAFDIETTGLNAINDRITEIGAVLFSGGEVKAEFNTFVNPGRPIPPDIVRLTGITDNDVKDAPSEEEALQMFFEFTGEKPLVAHNAGFDVGFMHAVAARHGIKYDPLYLDTLALSRALLPELKRHKLDTVSNYLALPKFNHHRASDDAMVCGRIMEKFLPMLRQQGAKTLSDIGTVCERLHKADTSKSYHMILLVKNKTGLKNLYKMVSESHLKYFRRTPIIPKSLLIQHREGILVGSACGMGELYGAVMRGDDDASLEKIAELYDYLEIQPICNNGFLIENGVVSDETEYDARGFRLVVYIRRCNARHVGVWRI